MARRASTQVVYVSNMIANQVPASAYLHRRILLQCDGNMWLYFDPTEAAGNFVGGGWYAQSSTSTYPLDFDCVEAFYLYSQGGAGWATTARMVVMEWNHSAVTDA